MNKQYRISRTESKIIELLRDNNAIESIKGLNSDNFSRLVDILNGAEVDYSSYTRWNDNMSIIKRLKDTEYNALVYIRMNRDSLFDDLNYTFFANNYYLTRLYNLVSKGVSKTLETLKDDGFMSEEKYSEIKEATDDEFSSIFIVGDLNTGKITLLNALLYEISDKSSNIVIFDSKSELQLDLVKNHNNISIKDLRSLTLEEIIKFKNGRYTFVTTDTDSDYFKFLFDLEIDARTYFTISSNEFDNFCFSCDRSIYQDSVIIRTENVDGKKMIREE